MDIVDVHVHATVYLYETIYYFHAFHFKRFNSFSLKLLSADGTFIFLNTLVAYCGVLTNLVSIVYMHERRKQANQLYNQRTSMENYS